MSVVSFFLGLVVHLYTFQISCIDLLLLHSKYAYNCIANKIPQKLFFFIKSTINNDTGVELFY